MVCGRRYQFFRSSVVYDGTCIACHGPDTIDIPGPRKDWKTNKFTKDNPDAGVVAFVKQGRPTTDTDNTICASMPTMGGNNALTDKGPADVIA